MFKTKDGQLAEVERLTWSEASVLLRHINSNLVKIINEIDPNPGYYLYKASYHFGAQIIYDSDVYLPLINKEAITFNDPLLPQQLSEDLSYDDKVSNPLGIMLNRNSEFYLSMGNRIMPHMLIGPGEIFGLARILDNVFRPDPASPSSISAFGYNLNAGARSVFLLPKITESISHNKLKKQFDLTTTKPTGLEDHWSIFKEISDKSDCSWRADVLFFSNKWISQLGEAKWKPLLIYFSQIFRTSYSIWHNIQGWEATFSKIEQDKLLNSYFSQYALDTAKHLFTIAANRAPGFSPAIDDISAPVELMKDVYTNAYGLVDYWPIIMESTRFDKNKGQAVYYSLNYATLPKYNPETFKGKTIVNLLDEVQYSIEIYQDSILNSSYSKANSLYNAALAVEFSCYHNDPGSHTKIESNTVLPEKDHRFISNGSGIFPQHSQFLKGCIKIAPRLMI